MKEITVRVTKQLEKDVSDLDKCATQCDDRRQQKTLERISKNLKKYLGFSSRVHPQSGGMALIDQSVYNTGYLIPTGGSSPIDAGAAGAGLSYISAPFFESGAMGAGALFSEGAQSLYLPDSSPISPIAGGGQKKRSNATKKTKTKKQ